MMKPEPRLVPLSSSGISRWPKNFANICCSSSSPPIPPGPRRRPRCGFFMTVVEEMFTTAGLSCFTSGAREVWPGTFTWTACWPVESCHSCLPVSFAMGAGAVAAAGGPASARPSMAQPVARARTTRVETMVWGRIFSSESSMRLYSEARILFRTCSEPVDENQLGLGEPAHPDAGGAQDAIADSITGADLLHHHVLLRHVPHRHQIDGLGEVGVIAQTHHLDALRAEVAHLLRQRGEREPDAVDERTGGVAGRLEQRLRHLGALGLQDAGLLPLQARARSLAVLDEAGIAAHELVDAAGLLRDGGIARIGGARLWRRLAGVRRRRLLLGHRLAIGGEAPAIVDLHLRAVLALLIGHSYLRARS